MVIKTRSKLTLHPVAFPPTKLRTQNDDNNNNNDDDDNNDNNNNNNNNNNDNNNRIRNMVSLKLGKELEKDVLCSP